MPTDRHLEIGEVTDFSPGFWDAGSSFLMPSEAWQTMEGCHPEPGGGVRAAMEPSAWAWTMRAGETALTGLLPNLEVIGLLFITNDERYVWFRNSAFTHVYVYHWNGVGWLQIKDHTVTAGAVGPVVLIDTFKKSTAVDYVVYTLALPSGGSNATIEGLWSINRTSFAVALEFGSFGTPTALAVMDDVAVVAWNSTLYFSTSGTLSFSTTLRFLEVQASRQRSLITALIYKAPSDLMVGTEGSVWSIVQGDLATNPTVRSLSDSHPVGTGSAQLQQTDMGIAYVEDGRGIMVTADGLNFENISKALEKTRWVQTDAQHRHGDVIANGRFILAPHGFCFDTMTQAWFTLRDIKESAGNSIIATTNMKQGTLIAATGGLNPTVYRYDSDEHIRENTYTLKSAPFRSTDGRRIRIRQIQILADFFHVGDSFTVTVNGTARTYTAVATGFNIVNFLFKEEAEYLDVTITANANTGANEAPAIEAIRIGKATSHRSN